MRSYWSHDWGLTVSTQPWLLTCHFFLIFKAYFRNYWTNSRHVGTYLNAFLIVNSNIMMKLNHFDIFNLFFWHFRLSSAHTCRVETVKIEHSVWIKPQIERTLLCVCTKHWWNKRNRDFYFCLLPMCLFIGWFLSNFWCAIFSR